MLIHQLKGEVPQDPYETRKGVEDNVLVLVVHLADILSQGHDDAELVECIFIDGSYTVVDEETGQDHYQNE